MISFVILQVQMPTLKSIAVLCYQNEEVAKATATGIKFISDYHFTCNSLHLIMLFY